MDHLEFNTLIVKFVGATRVAHAQAHPDQRMDQLKNQR
jgi:hypothetical protein